MGFKERFRKLDIYFQLEEKLKNKTLELEEVMIKLEAKNFDLQEINKKISLKKSELESLKTEAIELKDFINQKFQKKYKNCEYYVDIADCYIASFYGKKYITLKKHSIKRSDWFTIASGYYNVETYKYYDALNTNDGKYNFLYEYKYEHDDYCYFKPKRSGQMPSYEIHILEAYPELSVFVNGKVPNTYLQKIYYEENDLGNKKLIKDNSK